MKDGFYQRVQNATNSIKAVANFSPKIGIVLGSGLNDVADRFGIKTKIPYSQIEGFLPSKVQGHRGELYINEDLAVLAGRFHYYEHQDIDTSVLPIFVLKQLGVETLVLTNAAGGINSSYNVSDVVLISDHINWLPNPLIGHNDDRLGKRFPDMSNIYKKNLIQKAKSINPDLKTGVYLGITGPSFETPAEIRMLDTLGVDLVGMSTTAEAISANYQGMNVLGISTVTDMCVKEFTGKECISHEEVLLAGKKAASTVSNLIYELVKVI